MDGEDEINEETFESEYNSETSGSEEESNFESSGSDSIPDAESNSSMEVDPGHEPAA